MPFHGRASLKPRTSTPQVCAWLLEILPCMLCLTACRPVPRALLGSRTRPQRPLQGIPASRLSSRRACTHVTRAAEGYS